MFPKSKVTEIYCMTDDFCKEFLSAKTETHHSRTILPLDYLPRLRIAKGALP